MLSSESERLLKLCKFVREKFDISTIILFGSTARKKVDSFSDVDLLLIFDSSKTDAELPISIEIREFVPESIFPKNELLSFSVYSTESFADSYRKGSLFVLHVLREGIVLYDDGFYSSLSEENFRLSNDSLKNALEILCIRLEITEDLKKFNSYFIRCLTIFYAISRNLAFIVGALNEKPNFDRNAAFAEFAEIYPKYKEQIKELAGLRPFFLRSAKGAEVALPFEPNDIDKVIYLREALRKLLDEVLKHVKHQHH